MVHTSHGSVHSLVWGSWFGMFLVWIECNGGKKETNSHRYKSTFFNLF